MRHEVESGPAYSLLNVTLDDGEQLQAEGGAMVSHGENVSMDTNATGGFLKSLRRSVFGGESFFQNTFTATGGEGDLTLAPPLPGDVTHEELNDETIYVQSGSYVAGDTALDVDTEFGGAKTFFGSEGLFLLKVSGSGSLFVSSYGAIKSVDLSDGESYTVDTGHIVAFEASADFAVRRVAGLKSTVFSGEGLVCRFEGPGRIWLQTRSPDAFLSWLLPKIPQPTYANNNP
ncbi:TIGR00266 family protein (plasmid) [Halorussus limi]|uniref:TIGR00266 family protein n=1 Tax=Halorussus limi TaxID=2938695 RepID=A0A8U0HZK3_9EURY|nr:TIGR00266 family protein [Halorussus limi]UPV76545.1 TIGR00266 family protein [Halorussus limi]